jgi:hypothetical protein
MAPQTGIIYRLVEVFVALKPMTLALGLTVLSIVSIVSPSAHARSGNACSLAVTEGDADLASATQLKTLYRTFHKLGPIFSEEAPASAEILQKRVDAIQSAAKTYFKAAKIGYEMQPVITVSLAVGDRAYDVAIREMIVTGSLDGDATSRLFYAFGSDQKNPATFRFIPTLTIDGRLHTAGYDPIPQTIEFGPTALTDRFLGFGDPLRHEVQHHFEEIKIRNGSFTLARFVFSNTGDPNAEMYDARLSLDELETHLRDLRHLLKISPRKNRTGAIAKKPKDTKDNFLILDVLREMAVADKAQTLEEMIFNSKRVFESLKARVKVRPPAGLNSDFGLVIFVVDKLKNSPYPKVSIQVTPSNANDPQSILRDLHDLIDRADARIAAIEVEFKKLSEEIQ